MNDPSTEVRNSVESAVGSTFPDLRVEKVEMIGRGWDNTAFLVNEEIVFRLPNKEGDTRDQRRLREHPALQWR